MNANASTPVRDRMDRGPVAWLFIGDSITEGALHTFGFRDFSQLFAEQIRFEMGRSTDLVLNGGFSGATSGQVAERLPSLLTRYRPDVTILTVGVNDSSSDRDISAALFGAHLAKIATITAAAGSLLIVQTSNPILSEIAKTYAGRFSTMMDEVRNFAAGNSFVLIDHDAHWREWERANPRRNIQYLLSDAVHPNVYGHRLLAVHLLDELGIHDPSSILGRLLIP